MDKIEKKSFVIYISFYESIGELSDEKLGKLFRAIFESEIDVKPNLEKDPEVKMAFRFIRSIMDIDHEKYLNVCERNTKNGLKGGRPKKIQENPNKPKKPTGFFKNPTEPKKPDKEKENKKEKEIYNYLYREITDKLEEKTENNSLFSEKKIKKELKENKKENKKEKINLYKPKKISPIDPKKRKINLKKWLLKIRDILQPQKHKNNPNSKLLDPIEKNIKSIKKGTHSKFKTTEEYWESLHQDEKENPKIKSFFQEELSSSKKV